MAGPGERAFPQRGTLPARRTSLAAAAAPWSSPPRQLPVAYQPELPLGELHKRCGECSEIKPMAEFHLNSRSRDGRQWRCKTCNIRINREWYANHPEVKSGRMSTNARQRRLDAHWRILDYLRAHPCVDCGEPDPVVLDFDHLRDKVKNISAMLRHRWDAVLAEIDKCEVVCANCHRRRTARRANSFRYRERNAQPPWEPGG
jgi:5-methylcytosine-specific restriction endonuclease McrA